MQHIPTKTSLRGSPSSSCLGPFDPPISPRLVGPLLEESKDQPKSLEKQAAANDEDEHVCERNRWSAGLLDVCGMSVSSLDRCDPLQFLGMEQ